jgi:hypothetical protein
MQRYIIYNINCSKRIKRIKAVAKNEKSLYLCTYLLLGLSGFDSG